MKVTGYKLREAIKEQELRRDTAARAFDGSLKKFAGEDKETPQAITDAFLAAETKVARLQTVQMRYNLAVEVSVGSDRMTLAEAIKRVGGTARVEKMWRSVAGPKPDRYAMRGDDSRDDDKIYAAPTVTTKEAMKAASAAAKRAGEYRAAIATGNATAVDFENLDPALFE